MRATSISSEELDAVARASASPVTVPKRVNAIDMAKSPEFTPRPNNRSGGKRFRDLFRQITGTKAMPAGLRDLLVRLFGFQINQYAFVQSP
jgi:hypothetical protein